MHSTGHINPNEFGRRRRQLMRMMGKGAVAILPAAPVTTRNRDAEHAYRQDSDFYYLTGFPEPEAVMVLVPGRKQAEYVLFCRERDPAMEIWNGRMAGIEGACEAYGADDAFPVSDIDDILPGLLEGCERVYYSVGLLPEFDKQVFGWVNSLRNKSRSGCRPPEEFISLEHFVHDMRLFKSRAEISMMKKAAKVSVQAHKRVMRMVEPGMNEYEVEAELLHEFSRNGCHQAYLSIVGCGENGCVLHYVENNQPLVDGELLLIDAGAEYDNYAADITRTFPVNGVFTEEQKTLYQVVLDAQLAAIEQVRPGNHWNDPHEAAVRVITAGLLKAGLLKGSLKQLIRDEKYKQYYMHRTGHWLGMDVHDVGDYKVGGEWRVLEPGMVMTVEPGLYIPAGSKGVAKKWWNIGIRIEDDVLVTKDGCQVLTDGVPKEIDEIEAFMAK